jgi:hypothetical protein
MNVVLPINSNEERRAWNEANGLPSVSHEMRAPDSTASGYIETLRYNWSHASDGTTWEIFLERKLSELRDGVQFWSYCTDSGMRREAPEKVDELCDFLMSLGIAPYSMRR